MAYRKVASFYPPVVVLYARLPLGNSTTAEELWFSSVQCRGDIYPGGALKNYTHAYIEMDKVYGQ